MFDDDAAYEALRTHDARFDGRVFVGVTSTGIYCRPVCRVRTPLRRNCRFFTSAALAEHGGFRPCLRCRPELAPGLALVDSPRVLALQAARMLTWAARAGEPLSMPVLAGRLGVTDRHLRRIFGEAHGVTPLHYLTTQRVLMARQLLTDTDLPVAQVALAAGFESLRRFNAAFAAHMRQRPSEVRRRAAEAPAEPLALRLAYRPPLDADGLLRFFTHRAVAGVEAVDGRTLRRTLVLRDAAGRAHAGWVAMTLDDGAACVNVRLAPALAPMLGRVVEAVRQGLDLDADPQLIDAALAALPGPPGVRVPGSFDGFEGAVRMVLGQQVTVAAARTLALRLVRQFGAPVATPWPDLDRAFPDAATLAAADPDAIGRLGIVRQRVAALQALARAAADGRIALHRGAPLEATLQALRALPGVGEWTAQMIALRVLAWPDAWAAADIGVLKALDTRDVREAETRARDWRPWRAYALVRLWQGLETTT